MISRMVRVQYREASDPETLLVLTPTERRDALVAAGQRKLERMVRERQAAPLAVEEADASA